MDEYTRKTKIKDLISAFCTELSRIYMLPVIDATTDLESIVERLGGAVCYSRDSTDRIYKTSDTSFLIEIPVNYDEKQTAWCVGQLLGNLFLHMGFRVNAMRWTLMPVNKPYNCRTYEEQEQSNLFAGFFLMPEYEFRRIMDLYTEGSTVYTNKIAKHFGVSVSTAHWWGVTLGYLKPDFS